MQGRKVYEITGYADTENGCAYCLDCMGEAELLEAEKCKGKWYPICLGDEWDAPGPSCDNCHALIEINPIHYKED